MTVKLNQDTIINHGGSAIEVDGEDKVEISECFITGDSCKFWDDPLLWLGLKIIKRKYNQITKHNLKPIEALVTVCGERSK